MTRRDVTFFGAVLVAALRDLLGLAYDAARYVDDALAEMGGDDECES